jgi:hypothetical protein
MDISRHVMVLHRSATTSYYATLAGARAVEDEIHAAPVRLGTQSPEAKLWVIIDL